MCRSPMGDEGETMKKPAWISVLGWLTLAYGLILVTSWVAASTQNWSVDAVRGLAAGTKFFFPPLGLWVIGTIAHKLTAYKSRLQGQALADALRQAQAAAARPAENRPRK